MEEEEEEEVVVIEEEEVKEIEKEKEEEEGTTWQHNDDSDGISWRSSQGDINTDGFGDDWKLLHHPLVGYESNYMIVCLQLILLLHVLPFFKNIGCEIRHSFAFVVMYIKIIIIV